MYILFLLLLHTGTTHKYYFVSAQLLIFYTLFYIVLAALFAICMQGLFATLDDKVPKWQLDSSLIGTNPGMGFRPISSRTEEGSLIWYNTGNASTITKWVHLLDEFLEGKFSNDFDDNTPASKK